MRFSHVRHEGRVKPAVLDEERWVLLDDLFADITALIEAGTDGIRQIEKARTESDRPRLSSTDVQLAAPIQRFRRDVLCTGWNYWDHFEEGRGRRDGQEVERPKAPTFFNKSPFAIIGPCDPIAIDERLSKKWDYEAELTLIIGRAGRSIPAHRALEHIFGYCLANDISQRDLQRRHGGQWMRGKSADGTTPLGPMLVTPDELDIPELQIECCLNGKQMQNAQVKQMAFAIPELIAEISFGMTLVPGDVLLTGTPAGVGNARTPPVFLKAGDTLITRGTGLGELCNTLLSTDLYGDADIVI